MIFAKKMSISEAPSSMPQLKNLVIIDVVFTTNYSLLSSWVIIDVFRSLREIKLMYPVRKYNKRQKVNSLVQGLLFSLPLTIHYSAAGL